MSHPPDGEDLDQILIEKIRKGVEPEKSSAQERLYKRWCPRVYKFFIRKGFTEAECEELTQEAFLRVFNSIDDFRGGSFGSWLWTIVASVYKNEVRRRRTSKRDARETSFEQVQEDDPGLLVDRPSLGASPGQNPLDAILEKEDQEALHRAIGRMPPKMQSCCYMRYVQRLKYREIAVILKISLGTVKAHLAQAKQRLRDELGIDLAPEPGD
jgi:RNA polymerase sigma-70 factor (ECF subfamily)